MIEKLQLLFDFISHLNGNRLGALLAFITMVALYVLHLWTNIYQNLNVSSKFYIRTTTKLNGTKEYWILTDFLFIFKVIIIEESFKSYKKAEKRINELKKEINELEGRNTVISQKIEKVQ